MTTRMIKSDFHERLALYYMLLTRQMTKLSDCFFHMIRLDFKPEEERKELFIGYRAYVQSELADVIRLVKNICFILGISYIETESMGNKRDKEKREEFIKKYPNEPWV